MNAYQSINEFHVHKVKIEQSINETNTYLDLSDNTVCT